MRIRLNQEYRNKIANRMRVHLEQEDTVEKQNYDNLKADQIDINDKAWKLAEKIVRRHYTDDDVDIVSGNTKIKGKGLNVKKNGQYIKIKGKAVLNMLLSKNK